MSVSDVIKNILGRSLELPVSIAAKIKPTYIASILQERFTIIFVPSFSFDFFFMCVRQMHFINTFFVHSMKMF